MPTLTDKQISYAVAFMVMWGTVLCVLGVYFGGGLGIAMMALGVGGQAFIAGGVMTGRKSLNGHPQHAQGFSEVLSALSSFDLPYARTLLGGRDEDEVKTLHSCLVSLEIFKPFIPSFVMPHANNPIPEARHGHSCFHDNPSQYTILDVTVVNTNSLWNRIPEEMAANTALLTSCVANCTEIFNGKFIRLIGENSIIVFATAMDGLQFALMLQNNLSHLAWSPNLKSIAAHGIRTKIGIISGTLSESRDYLTGMPCVTPESGCCLKAIVRLCVAGCAAISHEILGTIEASLVAETEVIPIGSQLVGSKLINVSLVVPDNEMHRLTCIRRLIEPLQKGTSSTVVSPLNSPSSEQHSVFDSDTENDGESSSLPRRLSMRNYQLGTRNIMAGCVLVTFADEESYLSESGSTHIAASMSSAVDVVHVAAERCYGGVITVISNAVYLQWNATGRCPEYVENSFQFAALLRGNGYRLETGLCNGVIEYGVVGRIMGAYVTAIGKCIDISHRLAVASRSLTARCLVSTVPGEDRSPIVAPRLQNIIRPVDTWTISGAAMYLYQLDALHPCTWGWSNEYREKYHMSDHSVIEEHSSEDAILREVVANLRRGTNCFINGNF